jgi:hypothetical protein
LIRKDQFVSRRNAQKRWFDHVLSVRISGKYISLRQSPSVFYAGPPWSWRSSARQEPTYIFLETFGGSGTYSRIRDAGMPRLQGDLCWPEDRPMPGLMARRYPRSWWEAMMTFVLWCILLVICWPVALLALVLYPLVWLVLLPFRVVGIAAGGVLDFLRALMTLPARALGGRV